MRISDWSSDVCSSDLGTRSGLETMAMFEDVQAICPFARIEQGAAPNPIDQRRIAVEQRIDYWKPDGQGVAAFRGLHDYVAGCGLEHYLLELVQTRASQINACAYQSEATPSQLQS